MSLFYPFPNNDVLFVVFSLCNLEFLGNFEGTYIDWSYTLNFPMLSVSLRLCCIDYFTHDNIMLEDNGTK